MPQKKSRIGFLLASIHTGSASSMWKTVIREASHSDASLFIFPGGRLNVAKDSEYLRNSIYCLANPHNLDGLISWGSAIGSAVSGEELNSFHHSFDSLPYVTMAHKMPGHLCVKFDAYTGMSNLVRHFIEVHGTSKIAFLRGPETHLSSMERYRAFCDVMTSNGFDVRSSQLISDPVAWTEGEIAAAQLCQERHLVPGRDFEVLLAASDLMLFSAVAYLHKLGYNVPTDYKCAGFNDSVESRIPAAAFTTVHMPFSELVLSAFSMLRDVLAGNKDNDGDVNLSADVIVRESCGCSADVALLGDNSHDSSCSAAAVPQTAPDLVAALARLLRLDDTSTNAVIEPLVSVLEEQNEPFLFELLERALERFFEQDMDIRLLFKAIELVMNVPFLSADFASSLEKRFLITISRVQNRVQEATRFHDRKLHEELNSLKCELLAARSRQDLLSILHAHLPLLQINEAALVFTDEQGRSLFVGGFTPDSFWNDEIEFPSELLLPDTISGFDGGVFLVQPLFMERQPIGYLVCSVPPHDPVVFEELRSAISSALAGVFLFEQTALAKQLAEQAEQAKNVFFANVGTDLCEPLAGLSHKIEQIEQLIASGPVDPDVLAAQMVFLRTRIDEQFEKTNLVVDVTLSQTGELPFETHLFSVYDVVPAAEEIDANNGSGGKLPLLYGDPNRLRQAISLYCAQWGISGSPTIEKTDDGMLFTLNGALHITLADRQQNGLLLAEKILCILGAQITHTDNGCRILYPWPTFDCKNAEKGAPIFEWNAENPDTEEWARVYAMRNEPSFVSSAFLCTVSLSSEELATSHTFISLFERKMRAMAENPVLFVGSAFAQYPLWVTSEQTVVIPSMDSFDAAVQRAVPSLVVFDTIDLAAIEQLRLNPEMVLCPVFILPETIADETQVRSLLTVPRVILCNREIALTPEFAARALAVLSGDEILPPDTGALVKKAVWYINENAGTQISRWKLADSVHASEDYLTRIFHKETGLSPWEYLNRYRIYLASGMLLHTNFTIADVAEKCGFQDQAYFCRVFKKTHGVPPGKFRSNPL